MFIAPPSYRDENNAQGKDFLPWVNIQRKDRRQEANYEYTTI